MQLASSKIWTWVSGSISFNDNHDAKHSSFYKSMYLFTQTLSHSQDATLKKLDYRTLYSYLERVLHNRLAESIIWQVI